MSFVRDAVGITGAGLVLFGLYQWSIPLACIAGGLLLAVAAVIWSMKASAK